MRLWILLAVFLIALSSLVVAQRHIFVGAVEYDQYTHPRSLPFTLKVEKQDIGSALNLENVHAQVFIPELGIRSTSRRIQSLGRNPERLYTFLDIPSDTPMGEYWVRIQITNEANGKKRSMRTLHRPLIITERYVPESGVQFCPVGFKFCAS